MKKPPRKLAQSRRRWFVLLNDEIRYYKDSSFDLRAQRQIGAIGLFRQTKCTMVNNDGILLENPDRQWILMADKEEGGLAQVELWVKRINERINVSSNPGYLGDSEANEGGGEGGVVRKYSKRKKKPDEHRTYYGYGADESLLEPVDGEQETFDFNPDELQDCWYAFDMSTDVCEDVVLQSGAGSYLVRPSTSDASSPYSVVVNDSGKISKFSISKQADGELTLAGVGSASDLEQLVILMQRTPLYSKLSGASMNLVAPVGNCRGPTMLPKGITKQQIKEAVSVLVPKLGQIESVENGMLIQVRSQQAEPKALFRSNAKSHEWQMGAVVQIDDDGTCLTRLESGIEVWLPQSALCQLVPKSEVDCNKLIDLSLGKDDGVPPPTAPRPSRVMF